MSMNIWGPTYLRRLQECGEKAYEDGEVQNERMFVGGKKECPISIELDKWAKLCEYWSKPKIDEKAHRMANARKQVKKQSNVGRAGKARKYA